MQGLECWVGIDDVEGLLAWQTILQKDDPRARVEAVFVFAYRFTNIEVESDGREVYDFDDRQYTFFCVPLPDYACNMKTRSHRWRTVNLPAADFRKLVQPLRRYLLPAGEPA